VQGHVYGPVLSDLTAMIGGCPLLRGERPAIHVRAGEAISRACNLSCRPCLMGLSFRLEGAHDLHARRRLGVHQRAFVACGIENHVERLGRAGAAKLTTRAVAIRYLCMGILQRWVAGSNAFAQRVVTARNVATLTACVARSQFLLAMDLQPEMIRPPISRAGP
jgi:hypothetical protein